VPLDLKSKSVVAVGNLDIIVGVVEYVLICSSYYFNSFLFCSFENIIHLRPEKSREREKTSREPRQKCLAKLLLGFLLRLPLRLWVQVYPPSHGISWYFKHRPLFFMVF